MSHLNYHQFESFLKANYHWALPQQDSLIFCPQLVTTVLVQITVTPQHLRQFYDTAFFCVLALYYLKAQFPESTDYPQATTNVHYNSQSLISLNDR